MNTKHGNHSLIAGGYGLHSAEKAQPGSDAESEYPNGDQGSSLKHKGFWSSRDCVAQCNMTLTFTRRCRALLGKAEEGNKRACGGHDLPDLSILCEPEG